MKTKFISKSVIFKIILLLFFSNVLNSCIDSLTIEKETLNTELEVEKRKIKSLSSVVYFYSYHISRLYTRFDASIKFQGKYYYYYFNEKGNLTMKIDWDNDRSSDTLIYQYKYNHKDILEEVKVSDRINRIYEEHFFKYDDNGNINSLLTKDYWTNILGYPGPEIEIHKTIFKYNNENKLIEETTFDEVNNLLTAQYIISYDNKGNSKRDTVKRNPRRYYGSIEALSEINSYRYLNWQEDQHRKKSTVISVDDEGFILEEILLEPFGERIYDPETETFVEPKYSTYKIYQIVYNKVEYY